MFIETAFFCDEVEEIFARLRPFHDDDEGVVTLEAVEDLDDVPAAVHLAQQAYLQRHGMTVDLKTMRNTNELK